MITSKKSRTYFIFVTMFLDSLGIGIIIPILPDLMRKFESNPTHVSSDLGYFMAIYALMQFVASPVLGALSDRFGRRPVLLSSLFGAGIDYLLMAFAPTFPLLFMGRMIAGLTGASFTVAAAYIADTSDDSDRAANFGMIGAAFGLGFIVGPVVGGLVGGWLGTSAPFVTAAVLNLLNFAFGYFVLPESLPLGARRKIELKRLNPLSSLKRILSPSPILPLVFVYMFLYLSGNVHPSVWALYTQGKFGWSAMEVGFSLAFAGLTMAISQTVLTRILIPRLGETRAVISGIALLMITYAAYAFATTSWMMYGVLFIAMFAGAAQPALQSVVSRTVPSSEQGELQGSLVSLGSLMSIAAPILYTHLYAYYTSPEAPVYFPGAPYLCAAIIVGVAVVFAMRSKLLREASGAQPSQAPASGPIH